MQGVQGSSGDYTIPVEVDSSLMAQTGGAGVSHSGRDVAIICQPEVSPLAHPPSYSELFHAPPPSYREVMGLEDDVESAETPPASTHHGVEGANHVPFRCWRDQCTRRCVVAVATPVLGLMIGACFLYLIRAVGASPS